jgi:hypothetical protein
VNIRAVICQVALIAKVFQVVSQACYSRTRIVPQSADHLPVDIASCREGSTLSLQNVPDVTEDPIVGAANSGAVKCFTLLTLQMFRHVQVQ